jgi:hypothetical protein
MKKFKIGCLIIESQYLNYDEKQLLLMELIKIDDMSLLHEVAEGKAQGNIQYRKIMNLPLDPLRKTVRLNTRNSVKFRPMSKGAKVGWTITAALATMLALYAGYVDYQQTIDEQFRKCRRACLNSFSAKMGEAKEDKDIVTYNYFKQKYEECLSNCHIEWWNRKDELKKKKKELKEKIKAERAKIRHNKYKV